MKTPKKLNSVLEKSKRGEQMPVGSFKSKNDTCKFTFLKNERGLSIIAVVFTMLLLTSLGYTLSALMIGKQKSVAPTLEGGKSFFITEGGINYAGKYLNDLADWTTASNQTKSLGSGSFTVTFSDYTSGSPESIIATSTGTFGTGTRVLKASFER